MSIFYADEVKPVRPVEPTPDWEAALVAVSKRYHAERVAAEGGIQPDRAHELIRKCREITPELIAVLKDGSVSTKTAAVQWIKDRTEGFFPAAKYVQLCIDSCAPSTFAGLVAAAQTET